MTADRKVTSLGLRADNALAYLAFHFGAHTAAALDCWPATLHAMRRRGWVQQHNDGRWEITRAGIDREREEVRALGLLYELPALDLREAAIV